MANTFPERNRATQRISISLQDCRRNQTPLAPAEMTSGVSEETESATTEMPDRSAKSALQEEPNQTRTQYMRETTQYQFNDPNMRRPHGMPVTSDREQHSTRPWPSDVFINRYKDTIHKKLI